MAFRRPVVDYLAVWPWCVGEVVKVGALRSLGGRVWRALCEHETHMGVAPGVDSDVVVWERVM
jgi:hypothetical protein